jgi:hypothetical protein
MAFFACRVSIHVGYRGVESFTNFSLRKGLIPKLRHEKVHYLAERVFARPALHFVKGPASFRKVCHDIVGVGQGTFVVCEWVTRLGRHDLSKLPEFVTKVTSSEFVNCATARTSPSGRNRPDVYRQ